jgi:hypothetical protein
MLKNIECWRVWEIERIVEVWEKVRKCLRVLNSVRMLKSVQECTRFRKWENVEECTD